MKKISDCKNGEDVELVVRLADVQIKKTTTDADYASMIAFDGQEKIEAKMWKYTLELRNKLKSGEVYFAVGKMKDYQGKLQLNISDIRLISQDDNIDLTIFYETAPYSSSELRVLIKNFVKQIKNEILSKITMAILEKYDKEFYEYPAAVTMHHNYIGGLAYHTLCMLNLSTSYLQLYSFLNQDLTIAGIILHDIGKLIELSGPKGTEYTKLGKMIGHISLGSNEIYAISQEMNVHESEEITNLLHIILSHHGQLEYGSPKEPMTPEALLIYFLDLSDSKLAALEPEIKKAEQGQFTNPVISLDRRPFYIPKLK